MIYLELVWFMNQPPNSVNGSATNWTASSGFAPIPSQEVTANFFCIKYSLWWEKTHFYPLHFLFSSIYPVRATQRYSLYALEHQTLATRANISAAGTEQVVNQSSFVVFLCVFDCHWTMCNILKSFLEFLQEAFSALWSVLLHVSLLNTNADFF